MIEERDIRLRLQAFVASELSIEDFEEWLVDASWNMHADSAPLAVDAAESALLLLTEYGLGFITEPSLRFELQGLELARTVDAVDPVEEKKEA